MRNVGATAGVQSLPQACVICSRAFTVTARERHHNQSKGWSPRPTARIAAKRGGNEEVFRGVGEVEDQDQQAGANENEERLPSGLRERRRLPHTSSSWFPALWVVCRGVRCGPRLRLSRVRGLVLVRGGGACRAVGGGMRSRAALVDVRLDVVPLPPSSSSPTVAGCWLGGYPGRDRSGGKRVVGGMIPRINIGADAWGESSIMTGIYQRWCSSTLHIGWGLRDRVCLVLVCRGRYGLGRGRYGLGGGGNKHTRVVLLFILGSN